MEERISQYVSGNKNLVVKIAPKYEDLMLEVEAAILSGFNISWFTRMAVRIYSK